MQAIADNQDQPNFTTGPSNELKRINNIVGFHSNDTENVIIDSRVARMAIEHCVRDESLTSEEVSLITRGATQEVDSVIARERKKY